MSKPIKMTPEYLQQCRDEFEKALAATKLADGKITFTKTFTADAKKAEVHFTSLAWRKMTALLSAFDKEVAWHGVAFRSDDESKNEYIIEDIVVYPQEVTGASVEMDTEKYALWLMENAEDERFNDLHMQGHSHVNMGTSPSSVDLNHQEEILNMLGDDDFYIFMIWNKSLTSNTKIYDMGKNILFENADVSVTYEPDELDEFVDAAKKMVTTRTYKSPASTPGYGSGTYQYNRPAGAPYNPLAGQSTTPAIPPKDNGKGAKGGKDEKTRTRIGAGWSGAEGRQQSLYGDDDDDWSGIYGEFGQRNGWGG